MTIITSLELIMILKPKQNSRFDKINTWHDYKNKYDQTRKSFKNHNKIELSTETEPNAQTKEEGKRAFLERQEYGCH